MKYSNKIILGILFLLSFNSVQAHDNKLIKAIKVFDAALFGSGLVALSLSNLKEYDGPLGRLYISPDSREYLLATVFQLRIILEAYRVFKSSMQDAHTTKEPSDIKQIAQATDGVVISTLLSYIGTVSIKGSFYLYQHEPKIALLLGAFGVRCLAHVCTTSAPVRHLLS